VEDLKYQEKCFHCIGILHNSTIADSASLHKNFEYLLTFLFGYSIMKTIGIA
jgi:hypothetical protein